MTELDLTSHWTGLLSLAIFVIAYVLVIFEEATEMRKSKPVSYTHLDVYKRQL